MADYDLEAIFGNDDERQRLKEVQRVTKRLEKLANKGTQIYLFETDGEKSASKSSARHAIRQAYACGMTDDEIPSNILRIAHFT